MLALLLFIAIEGITEMDAIQGSLEGIVNVNNRELALTNIISSKVRDIASYTRNMVLLTDPADLGRERSKINVARAQSAKAEAQLEKMFNELPGAPEVEKEQILKIRGLHDSVMPLIDQVLALGVQGKQTEAVIVLLTQAEPATRNWLAEIEKLLDIEKKINEQAGNEAASSFAFIHKVMLGLTGLALLLGGLAAWLITRSITRPINRAVKIAQTVAGGDLTSQIEVTSKDETGQLLQALK
ncbi:MAG: MCP four helix bundle domain-containing protein, partial [Sulfuriferula sp.]